MQVEIPNDDHLARLELLTGYNLYDRAQTGEMVTLNEPQRFTAMSVLDGLTLALQEARVEAATAGEPFDEANWLPGDAAVAREQARHRPHRQYLRGIDGLKAYQEAFQAGDPAIILGLDLYPHQEEAFDMVIANLQEHDPFATSNQGGYLNISGGGGKSRLIAMLTEGFKYREDPAEPNRVFVIAADNEGIKELLGTDGTSGFGRYGKRLVERGAVGVVNKDNKRYDAEVVLTTPSSLRNMLAEDPQALEAYSLILADEVHKLTGDKTMAAVQTVRRRVIGLTGSADGVEELLPQELISHGTRELVLADRLSPLQFWVCKTGQVIYEESGRAEYTPDELDRISRMPERQKIMADAGLAYFRDNRNGIFAVNTVREANEFARAMNGITVEMPDGRERTIRVVAVHGDSKQDNHRMFRKLNNDEIQAVVIVDIDTGWDAPRASFIVNGRPTKSPRRAAQRDARTYRKYIDADGNIVTAQIFDLVDVVHKKRRSTEAPETGVLYRGQILGQMLLGQTTYRAGQVIAAPGTEGHRRDFSVSQFPPHLRWAVSMADGVELAKIPRFGAGVIRDQGPENHLTFSQAARGLAVSPSRLAVALAVTTPKMYNGQYLDETAVRTLEKYFLRRDEPLL